MFHVGDILFIIIWDYLLVIILYFTHLCFSCFIFNFFWILSSVLQLDQRLMERLELLLEERLVPRWAERFVEPLGSTTIGAKTRWCFNLLLLTIMSVLH